MANQNKEWAGSPKCNTLQFETTGKPGAFLRDLACLVDWEQYNLQGVQCADPQLLEGAARPDVSYTLSCEEDRAVQQTLCLFLFIEHRDTFHSQLPDLIEEASAADQVSPGTAKRQWEPAAEDEQPAQCKERRRALYPLHYSPGRQCLCPAEPGISVNRAKWAEASQYEGKENQIQLPSSSFCCCSNITRKVWLFCALRLAMSEDDEVDLNYPDSVNAHSNGAYIPPSGVCWISVLSCLLLACSYVGSLYVWRSDLPRDHPAVIKRRFTSVLIVSTLSPLFVWAWKEFTGIRSSQSLLALMGIRVEGLLAAATLPLLLTMVVAPLTEELVFRACMLPMLAPCAGLSRAIFTCPLFFGVAHFHHVIELLRFRQGTIGGIVLSAVFQFSYTAVFGTYTAFIFVRTGHLIGPVLCHSFCNYMGFPALSAALEHPQRAPIMTCYLLGVLLFLLLLFPMTEPVFYGSVPLCSLARTAHGGASLCS
ncbi:UNVERIFIED_CONTAM: hypothetical protein FKN15_078289 [Acipenser sinensis]